MMQIVGMSLLLTLIILIFVGFVVIWALANHYVTFWRVVEGIREFLVTRYIRAKII